MDLPKWQWSWTVTHAIAYLGFSSGTELSLCSKMKVLQDPLFVTVLENIEMTGLHIKPAMDGAIKKMDLGGLSKGNPKVAEAVVPFCLPLPLSWVPYFLEARRSNQEAYYAQKKMAKWINGSSELWDMSNEVLTWFWAVCMIDPNNPIFSHLDVETRPVPRDDESLRWTMDHLQRLVPRPLHL
jgi:hypothetical protein